MNIKICTAFILISLIISSSFQASGNYNIHTYLRDYDYSSYYYGMDDTYIDSLFTFIMKEYSISIKYYYTDKQDLTSYSLMNRYYPGIGLIACKGVLDYVREYSYSYTDGYDDTSTYSSDHISFDYKGMGFSADIFQYISLQAQYFMFDHIYSNSIDNFLNYSIKGRLPFYPLYVQFMFESDHFSDHSREFIDVNILYKMLNYDISLRLGNASKYSLTVLTHNANREYGLEISWLNLLYSNKFREINLFDYNKSNVYAFMIGSIFDSRMIGLKLMGGFNSKYRIILLPEFSMHYKWFQLSANALIANLTFLYGDEYISKNNSDSYVSFSVNLGIEL